MELGIVSTMSMAGMLTSVIVVLGVIIALIIIGKKKYKAKISSFFIGAAVFIIFAMILEQILHFVVLSSVPSIISNTLLYALYGGLAAAVFEETGRWLAIKFVMKKNCNFQNAFMYGVGHGGIEAILLCVINNIGNFIVSIMINNGTMQASLLLLDDRLAKTAISQYSALWTTSAGMFFASGFERVFAIILQIALSIIMYEAIKNKKYELGLLAYGIHFIVDFIVVVVKDSISIVVIEALVAIFAISAFMLSHYISKKYEK